MNTKCLTLSVVLFLVSWVVLGISIDGYVLARLWSWFIVPTFGLNPLSLGPAIGISLVASWLTRGSSSVFQGEKTLEEAIIEGAYQFIVYPIVFLVCGWLVKVAFSV